MIWPFRKRAQDAQAGPSWVTSVPPDMRTRSGRIGRGMASCDHCTRYFVSDTPSHAFYAWAHHQCLDE